MTVATIRSGVVTLLKAITSFGGLHNVYEEEPGDFDVYEKRADGRVHYWLVSTRTLPADDGAGWFEKRREVRIRGYIGVSRDNPTSGVESDVLAANLQGAVVDTLTASAQRQPGSSLGSDVPEPLSSPDIVTVQVGAETVPCHEIEITWLVYEE